MGEGTWLRGKTAIAGIGQTPWGKQGEHAAKGYLRLAVEAIAQACEDAGADITKRSYMEVGFDSAEQHFSRVDGVIDVVGIARWMDLMDLDDETWDFELQACLRHAFLAMQIGGRKIRATGGGVMAFVASISGIQSAPNHVAYGAAKAGLISLVRTAAVECGPFGVRADAVAPGATFTRESTPS